MKTSMLITLLKRIELEQGRRCNLLIDSGERGYVEVFAPVVNEIILSFEDLDEFQQKAINFKKKEL